MSPRRPIRIGNVAGAMEDCPHAMYVSSRYINLLRTQVYCPLLLVGFLHRMISSGPLDAIVGDWLSELNIAWNAIRKYDDPTKGYEVGFLEQLDDCINIIAEKRIKLVSNAGALNTPQCARLAKEICDRHGQSQIKIAYIEGDDISEAVANKSKRDEMGTIRHLDHPEQTLETWGKEPLCGRVTDASPVIALAAWWHEWSHDAWDQLAGALVAGHLIECGPYVTGANFTGVRPHLEGMVDLGFPIAEIAHDGSTMITKHPGHAGIGDEFNVRAQFLYEIQGTQYINPDVRIENTGDKDRVFVSGAIESPPPPTTKAIVVSIGGYQAEATFYMNGLDIDAKERFMRQQIEHAFADSNFTELSITRYGSNAVNRSNQALGTTSVRLLVKAKTKHDIREDYFRKKVYALRMQFYAGYHMSLDFRTMSPKMFMELFPGLISYARPPHRVIIEDKSIQIKHHGITTAPLGKRPSYETSEPVNLADFGFTSRVSLGAIAHARSSDKGDNCNVGFFARSADEYRWLKSYLTVAKIVQLLGEDYRESVTVERCEFPQIWAVHFRFLDFLGGGAASSTRIDMRGKLVAEYLRSKFVDVPSKFLANPISLG
ncbi:unnamed protein product [Clonostachys solani]|uniref:Uncharacterized protein n=1 Tax=Clonostachys solani TaxID=160281 RepID=A0A9P0ES87_9HYPO|nr:unnamed protein product [Clonostachys solani]